MKKNESGNPVPSDALFGTPAAVSRIETAFGGDMAKLLPPWESIPDEFKRDGNKWTRLVSRWFFEGLPADTEFDIKDGIDGNAAMGHLRAIMVSFKPKHEHKTAGVAYLLSCWFNDVTLPNASGLRSPDRPRAGDKQDRIVGQSEDHNGQ